MTNNFAEIAGNYFYQKRGGLGWKERAKERRDRNFKVGSVAIFAAFGLAFIEGNNPTIARIAQATFGAGMLMPIIGEIAYEIREEKLFKKRIKTS